MENVLPDNITGTNTHITVTDGRQRAAAPKAFCRVKAE
jgi:hypothetical protein